jgi:opacity protein-like surface antigen
MRLIKAALLVTVLSLVAPSAHAGDMTFGLGGGAALPTGDLSDFAGTGWNGNVYGDYWVKPNVAIGLDVDGSFFSAKDDVKNTLKTAFPACPDPKATLDLIGGGVHGTYAFSMKDSKVEPWITAGIGMYNVKSKISDSDPTINEDKSDTKVGYHGGVGADWKTSPTMKVGIDFKYNSVTDGTQKVNQSTGAIEKNPANYMTLGLHLTFMTNGATK